MIYQCPKCGLSKSDSAMGSVLPQCKCDWNAPAAPTVQEFGLTWERFNALESEIATLQADWQASLKDNQRLTALVRAQQITIDKLEAAPVQEPMALEEYDAGLLNDYGGGNVEWWQDYIRAELGRAYEHYQSQMATPPAAPVQCWKCGDMDAEFQAYCKVPACGMKEEAPQTLV